MKKHICIDCRQWAKEYADGTWTEVPPPTIPRPAPHGGPQSRRCGTHFRTWKHNKRQAARVKRSQKVYGLDPDDRAELMKLQDGKCPICGRGLDQDNRGRFRQTAHDHDHDAARKHDHPKDQACRECMRGLTCGWCNRELLARIDLEAARRLVAYYENPPMAQLRAAQFRRTA